MYRSAGWLFWRPHIGLGRNWSPSLQLREEHTLVTKGVYHSIRHPMFASMWLSALVVGAVIAAVGLVLVIKGANTLWQEDPTPQETIETLKEDREWLRDQTS